MVASPVRLVGPAGRWSAFADLRVLAAADNPLVRV